MDNIPFLYYIINGTKKHKEQVAILTDVKDLIAKALHISAPWQIEKVEFIEKSGHLNIYVNFTRGAVFNCPSCGKSGAKAYDTDVFEWRHLDFFQYQAYIIARVPRVDCKDGCGILKVNVPWARPGSGFTLLFDKKVMVLSREMPVATLARICNEHDTKLWRIINNYVEQGLKQNDFSMVKRIGIDETAAQRGHKYITSFIDLDTGKLLFATPGKGKDTVKAFVQDLKNHGGNPDLISEVCCDLSPSFIAGIKDNLPSAATVFDRFHLTKIVNDALDNVRRQESKETDLLKKTRYYWLKNPNNLTVTQRDCLAILSKQKLKTGRAYRIKLAFQDFFKQEDRQHAEIYLKSWYYWATHSRLDPMIAAAKTIKNHWDGVLNWYNSKVSNGILEGTNSLLQAGKSKARGYRKTATFITMSYMIAGKLDFGLPT